MANILLIEDDELIQHMYLQMLEKRKHHVVIANNGEEGLELARSANPDLILLDIMMPKMNGLDMLKKIKTIPGLSSIPVMMLTNLLGLADAEAALAAGALKYVIKSDYSPKEVADIVDNLLSSLKHKDLAHAA